MELVILIALIVIPILWFRGKAEDRSFMEALKAGAKRKEKKPVSTPEETEAARAAKATEKAEKREEKAVKRADKQFNAVSPVLTSRLDKNILYNNGKKFDITGADVIYENGVEAKRMTATRVVGGAVLLGPVGAVIGAIGKKDKTLVHIVVTTEDGARTTISAPRQREAVARSYADGIASASAYFLKKRGDNGPQALPEAESH